MQRRNSHLFVVPPVLQGNDLIPRSRALVFAHQREKKMGAQLAQKWGFCVSKTPVFAQPARRLGAFRGVFFARVLEAKPAVFDGARSNYFLRYRREFR